MSQYVRLLALAVISSVLFGANIACNTTEGIGQDTQKLGDKIEDAADRNK